MYAVAKEHGDGEYYRENVFVQAADANQDNNIVDIHDLMNATEEEREEFRKTVSRNLASAFQLPETGNEDYKKNKSAEVELRRRERQGLLS